MRLFKNTNVPFVQNRKIFFILSAILVIAAIVGIFVRGFNWSTDFKGGVTVIVNMKPESANVPALNIDELRRVINEGGFTAAEIQYIGDREDDTFQIKVAGSDATSIKDKILEVISTQLGAYTEGRNLQKDVIREFNTVGAKAGLEMRNNAILAVALALLLMIIYIWIRFEFTFGLMAIVALFHDVIIIVGIFSWTGKEITMSIVAALLTIVGYSINDTIVIFDRIREDLKIYRKDPVQVIFNRSMNETLSRTIITAGTTLFTALALYFFGGPVIHDFAFAMSLGIIFGTYSSIFVASNLVLDTIKATHQEKQSIKKLTKK